jgi:hypothetical protein
VFVTIVDAKLLETVILKKSASKKLQKNTHREGLEPETVDDADEVSL